MIEKDVHVLRSISMECFFVKDYRMVEDLCDIFLRNWCEN